MEQTNHLLIDIPESKLDFSDDSWKEAVKRDFQEIRNSLEKNPNNGSPAYYTWFLFFLKYGNALCSEVAQKYIKEHNTSVFNLIRDAVGLEMSSGGAYTVGYKFYDECIKNTKSIETAGISINIQNRSILSIPQNNDIQKNYYLRAMRTKPFLLLAGISGTGKSRIVRKLAQATVTEELQKKYDKNFKSEDFSKDRWDLHRPANFELIQVKPNWHNSMDVVGYLSNIPSPHYVFTPFIHFIVKAWQNTEVPFFLCLDEMNLAPVEEYFAEFLSAIESRDKQNGQYVSDPIIKPFNEFGDENIANSMIDDLFPNHKASKADEKFLKLKDQLLTKGLTLPPNLIVIGTVNMDETTFSFSRKVLDRAMSIEMNEVNYDAFLSGETDEGLKQLVENREDINELLVDRPIQAKEVMTALGDDADAVLGYLKRINTLLEGTPFKLGYRAANEAMLYLNASNDFGNNDWREAMDQFTLMKILSRIEGDTNKLRIGNGDADQKRLKGSRVRKEDAEKFGPLTLLTAMRVIIEEELKMVMIESSETENSIDEDGSIVDTSEIAPPKPEAGELESIKKLDIMISQLERERFVSYWN